MTEYMVFMDRGTITLGLRTVIDRYETFDVLVGC